MADEPITWLPPSPPEPAQTETAPPAPEYAGWGQRFGAYLLDLAIQIAFAVVVSVVLLGPSAFEEDSEVDGTLNGLSYVITAAASIAYFAILMRRTGARNGQTWGRQAAGIRVVRDDGRPVGPWFAAWRDYVVKGLVSAFTLGIDLLWPLWERENRTLHDLLLKTHVVRVPT
ncbi:MAG: hypothetical protein QOG77_2784 [Solirubrobacteraceae bacterium]|jgi:uncharacterized RDD family membrane protein YckC|nr:hypothetical protein [Solirubrobacteraceae bacterium]